MVVQCYERLPEGLLGYLENLDIVVEEWPSEEVLSDTDVGSAEGLLGLYTGVPRPERGDDLPFLPDKITLFQRPIEEICGSREEVWRRCGRRCCTRWGTTWGWTRTIWSGWGILRGWG